MLEEALASSRSSPENAQFVEPGAQLQQQVFDLSLGVFNQCFEFAGIRMALHPLVWSSPSADATRKVMCAGCSATVNFSHVAGNKAFWERGWCVRAVGIGLVARHFQPALPVNIMP